MLSDEERKAIENLKIEYEKLMKEDNILFPLYKSNAKRLIDIIKKQSKEIEELKEDNKKKSIVIIEYQDLYEKLEDKIKAKMKEKEWSLENYDCNEADYKQSQAIGAWSVLQSLLEKE